MKGFDANILRFNVLTVGPRSAGKTAFLRSLLSGYEPDSSEIRISASGAEGDIDELGTEKFPKDKVKILEVGRANVNSVGLVIYDSHGYGNPITNEDDVDTIHTHLMKSHAVWRGLDVQCLSPEEIQMNDERIHCVFYFSSGHSIQSIDRDFMSRLSPIVTIIPVIARADSMNLVERNACFKEMYLTIEWLSRTLGSAVTYDFGTSNGIATGRSTPLSHPSLYFDPSDADAVDFTEMNGDQERVYSYLEPLMQTSTSPFTLSYKADQGIALIASDYMARSPPCKASPEFIALFSHIDDFDNSSQSSLFDEDRPRSGIDRHDSLYSIATDEGLHDSNTSVTFSDRGQASPLHDTENVRDTISGIDSSELDHSTGGRSPISKMLSGSSEQDKDNDGDLETFFNQQTFVNIGKALSDSQRGTRSEEAPVDNMMESAVFVYAETDSRDEDDSEGSFPPTEDKHDQILHSAAPNPKALVCKIVTNKICNMILNPGEKAVCKIVSKIVCEHISGDDMEDEGRDDGEIDVEGITERNKGQRALVAKLITDSIADCRSASGRASSDALDMKDKQTVGDDNSLYLEKEAYLSTLQTSDHSLKPSVCASIESKGSENEDATDYILSSPHLRPYTGCGVQHQTHTVEANGTHTYPNIFAIMGNSNQLSDSDYSVECGLSDVNKIKMLLFDGPHIASMINQTRVKSIKLFPSKSAASMWINKRRIIQYFKEILRFFLFFSVSSSTRNFSNLFNFLDPVPLSSFCSFLSQSTGKLYIFFTSIILVNVYNFLSKSSSEVSTLFSFILTKITTHSKVFTMCLGDSSIYLISLASSVLSWMYLNAKKFGDDAKAVFELLRYEGSRHESEDIITPTDTQAYIALQNERMRSQMGGTDDTESNAQHTQALTLYVQAALANYTSKDRKVIGILKVVIVINLLLTLHMMVLGLGSFAALKTPPALTTQTSETVSVSDLPLTWVYTSSKFDLTSTDKSACTTSSTTSITTTNPIENAVPIPVEFVQSIAPRVRIMENSFGYIAGTRTHKHTAYPSPAVQVLSPYPTMRTLSIDTSSDALNFCLNQSEGGVFECLSKQSYNTPHHLPELSTASASNPFGRRGEHTHTHGHTHDGKYQSLISPRNYTNYNAIDIATTSSIFKGPFLKTCFSNIANRIMKLEEKARKFHFKRKCNGISKDEALLFVKKAINDLVKVVKEAFDVMSNAFDSILSTMFVGCDSVFRFLHKEFIL